jgi:DNA-binding transcriptional LysR family regulator
VSLRLETLRAFAAVARHGGLAEAARALGRTPSALSMSLARLEAHLGAPLFETGRKTRLTPLGRVVQAEAERELARFDAAAARIEAHARAGEGLVRVAATPSVAAAVLPAALARFRTAHPRVSVTLRDMDSAAVRRAVREEAADFGLAVAGPAEGLEGASLFSDPFGVVCPRGHPLTAAAPVGWTALAAHPFIANGLCALIEDPGFAPVLAASRLNVPSTASLLAMLRAGLGVTLLPRLAAPADLAFLPLAGPPIRREVQALAPAGRSLSPAAAALLQVVQDSAAAPEAGEFQRD